MTTTRPPITIPPALEPLTKERRWVGWRWIKGKDGKPTKPPFRADAPHLHASSTDPSTWCPFNVAMSAYCRGEVDGIGFALSGSEYSALDLDDSRIAASGVLVPWAAEQIRLSDSYAEVTPSDEGTRVIGRASGPPLHKKYSVPGNGALTCELYRRADRYITITGRQIGNATQLADIDARIDALHAELEGARRTKDAKQDAKQGNAKQGNSGKNGKQRDLDALIKDGCGQDFGGDRSRATWYVIHALLKQGRSPDDIVAILINPANGISAHCLDQSRPEDYARKQVDKASAGADGTDAELERLAKLPPVQYEHERKQAAERLNVRASILDKLVAAERERLNPDDGSRQGHAIAFPDPEPWPDPIEGAALLEGLAAAIRRHVVLPDHARDACALWVVHTYLTDRFLISPRLGVRSPTKGCGKTLLLDVLDRVVARPLPTANVTAAAIFRVIEAHRPTLLVDEADTFLYDNDELRGVLNSGHRKGGAVLRTVGDDHEPRSFATYAPCVIALIGALPDTLHDRAVTIDLKRRLPSEKVEPFRPDRADHLDVLARKAARWAKDHADRIGAVDPAMPEGIINRAADNWRPLLAIADVAGREWPELARKAAQASRNAEGDDGSRLEILLQDIRDAFADRADMPSADLVKVLVELEGRPWAELGKSRKPLTQNRLARMLKPLSIAPQKIGPGKERVNGYVCAHFKEAFRRYLGSEGDSQPDNWTECDEIRTSEILQPDSPKHASPAVKCEKPNNDGLPSGCPVGKRGNGKDAKPHLSESGLSSEHIRDLAEHYTEAAYRQNNEGADIDSRALDADLRRRLAGMVLPEFVEIEFERVMQVVFRV